MAEYQAGTGRLLEFSESRCFLDVGDDHTSTLTDQEFGKSEADAYDMTVSEPATQEVSAVRAHQSWRL